jgi:hypothetical protein
MLIPANGNHGTLRANVEGARALSGSHADRRALRLLLDRGGLMVVVE